MPRINFIPPPISFNDRSSELVSPIMSNAMQLMETFSTDIPRIRMQQAAVEEDKRRYQSGVDREASRYSDAQTRDASRYKDLQDRQGDADFLQQHAGWEMLMRPDALDLDGDGKPDVTGNVSSKGVTLPKMGAAGASKTSKPKDFSTFAQNYAKNAVTPKTRKNVPVMNPTTGKPYAEAGTGAPVVRDEQESEDEVKSRLREIMFSLRKANSPVSRAQAKAIYDQGFDPSRADPITVEVDQTWAEMNDWAHTVEDADASAEAAATVGSEGTPTDSRAAVGGSGGSTAGSPIHSAMGRMLALQKLDRLAASDPAKRARLGLPSNLQIEQLKMQIYQQGQQQTQPDAAGGEQPAAEQPAAEQPAAPVPPLKMTPVLPPAETARLVEDAKREKLARATEALAGLRALALTGDADARGRHASLLAQFRAAGLTEDQIAALGGDLPPDDPLSRKPNLQLTLPSRARLPPAVTPYNQ